MKAECLGAFLGVSTPAAFSILDHSDFLLSLKRPEGKVGRVISAVLLPSSGEPHP